MVNVNKLTGKQTAQLAKKLGISVEALQSAIHLTHSILGGRK